MIELMQGTPGSGKSASAVSRAFAHLRRGGVVASNIRLVDGWAEIMAAKTLLGRFSKKFREKYAENLYKRYYLVQSLDAIRQIVPKKEAVGILKDNGKYYEGAGLLILDESQLIFNARKWDKNFGWMEFFTQHRKLGWNVLMIAHKQEMIDSQIRDLCEYESRFRNLQKCKIPWTPFPMSPFPLFLVIRRYAGLGAGVGLVHDRELFPLPVWAAQLYNSNEVFSADTMKGEPTKPENCGPPPALPGVVHVPRPCYLGDFWEECKEQFNIQGEPKLCVSPE